MARLPVPSGTGQWKKPVFLSFEHDRLVRERRNILTYGPAARHVVCIHCTYTKLARAPTYQRRVTLITDYPIYIVEYLGSFPKHIQSNGNARSSGAEYVHTHLEV